MNPEVHVTIFDTTVRDGAQSLPAEHQFPEGSKPEIAHAIAKLGVGVIEAGFPTTPTDGAEVEYVAAGIGQYQYDVKRWRDGECIDIITRPVVLAGLSRATEADVLTCWEALKAARAPRIHTFVSTSDFHREAKFPGVSRTELLEMGQKAVMLARDVAAENPSASVEFSAEAASTTDLAYLADVVAAVINEGVDVVNLPDTVGERDPRWMYDFYRAALRWIHDINPAVTLSAHNHNDLDQAAANSMMLVTAATDHAADTGHAVPIQIESTVCGLGERAGNADVFPIVASLFKFTPESDVPVLWEFNPQESVETASIVMGYAGFSVDRQSPIVGRDTNVHRSGIHSDGVIKGGFQMYTPHNPTFWGHDSEAVHEEGKYQGRAGRQAAVVTSKGQHIVGFGNVPPNIVQLPRQQG